MLSNQKPIIERYLEPVADLLSDVHPNVLTLIGSIPSLLFFVCIVYHLYLWAIVAFLGNGFDMIDGMIARKYGKVTSFGGFLDSMMDRVADFFMITAFAFGNIARWEIVAPVLLFSYLISYARSRGELASENKVKFNVGIIERSERLFFIFLALILYIVFPHVTFAEGNIAEVTLFLLAILSAYTVLQRIIYAYKKLD